MKGFSLILLFLTALSVRPAEGKQVTVKGSGNGYRNLTLKISRLSDPVTREHVPLLTVSCDDEGSFFFSIDIDGTQTIIIESGIYYIFFYASAGKDYVLRLPAHVPKTREEEQDTFFYETWIMPDIVNDPHDINNLIREFDNKFNPLFNIIADRVRYNVKKDEIPSMVQELNRLSPPDAPQFYRDFVKYRMIMLNMVGRGEYAGRLEDSVMMNRKFDHDNPAYLDLIEQAFNGLFANVMSGTSSGDLSDAINSSSLARIKKVISRQGRISDDALLEYVILLNLYPRFYAGTTDPAKVLALLSAATSEGSVPYIREIAALLLERMEMSLPGADIPDFSLTDSDGKRYSLKDFNGKHLLMVFARSDNSFSLAELGVLRSWYNKYSAKVSVVIVLRDADFKTGSQGMKFPGTGWILLDGSGADQMDYLFNVKIYPAFFLIRPDGKRSMKDCPFPTENLEALLKTILAEELR